MAGGAFTAKSAITRQGLTSLADVVESDRATDLAFQSKNAELCIVRCVIEISDSDYHALKTMLAQGDFTRAAIVYTSEDQPHLTGEIEAYPISRIDELAASLARESAP